jgi:hypothetical protein
MSFELPEFGLLDTSSNEELLVIALQRSCRDR